MLRRCTFAGRPFGDESFIQQIETESGRTYKRWNYDQALCSAEVSLRLDALAAKC